MNTPIVPEQPDGPKLAITPEGVEIYYALSRGKEFLTLHYRKDKPVRLATVLSQIGLVLDDIAQAGLLVRGSISLQLAPLNIDHVTSSSAFTSSIKVEVRPRAEQAQDDAAWAEGIRAYFNRKAA